MTERAYIRIMNISTSHTNTGYHSKHIQVTYAKLREVDENLGKVPVTDEFRSGHVWGGSRFVASTLENPVGYADYASADLVVKNPVLDAAGKPVIETVTETIELPGPKRQGLLYARDMLVASAVLGSGVTLMVGGMGALMGAMMGDTALMFKYGLGVGATLGALTAGQAVVDGLVAAKNMCSGTNTLSMEQTPIVDKQLEGYDVLNRVSTYETPYLKFKPRLKETVLGVWEKPTITYG